MNFATLRSKILFFLLGFLFLIVAIQSVVSLWVTRSQLIGRENLKIENYVRFSSGSFIDAYNRYYQSDFPKFTTTVRKLRDTLPIIDTVQLVDTKGNILFDVDDNAKKDFRSLGGEDNELLPYIEKSDLKFFYQKGGGDAITAVVYPLVEDMGFHKYTLIYRVSYQPLTQQIVESLGKTYSVVIPVFLLIFLVGTLVLVKLLNPLSALNKGVKIVNEGNLDYKLKVEGGDELAQLALGFNKMAQDYKYTNIRAQRVSLLEAELKKRQQELDQRFKDLQAKSEEIESFKKALLNLSEDASLSRDLAVKEKDKTMAIVNNFADGVVVFDAQNRVTVVNPQFEKYFNVSTDSLKAKKFSDFRNIKELSVFAGIFQDDIVPMYRKEVSMGENIIFEVSSIIVKKSENEIGEKLLIFHDVTREKAIERTKSEFVSIAAHQLRTPLSAIKWIFGMMKDGDWGKVTAEQKEYLGKGYISTERLIKIVNDLLNVSRIEEGRFTQKTEKVQMDEMMNTIYNQYQDLAETKKLKLLYKKPEGRTPSITVDREQFKMAIENLVENAMNYTPAGGEVVISLRELKQEKALEVAVSDSGIGIPKDQKNRIFTKFFRSSNALRRETSGSGLGLFVTKNIIESHGGKIWFESEENKGTSFYFTIPIS